MKGPLKALELLTLGALSVSCALLTKSEALNARYFSPEGAHQSPDSRHAPMPTTPTSELRLGRVNAAGYLGERIVYRDSKYELNFYDERRWAENPDVYLRRALGRALFEERGLRRIVAGAGPTLEVELDEFAELRAAPARARVRVTYRLYDNRITRREATLTLEKPIATEVSRDDAVEPKVRAMAEVLNEAVEQIATQVMADLSASPASSVTSDSIGSNRVRAEPAQSER
ncbi:MAG TPA: ABC-type transport auxiliary lipoprotein family protein [Polyangiaceae bacterium]|nr:ABC-type transport auxiliary lipoprotein family protein [Polyangiaceae bacterium]